MKIREKIDKIRGFIYDVKHLKEYKDTIEKQDREYDVIRSYNTKLNEELKFITSQKDHYLKMLSKKNKTIKELRSKIKELENGVK